MSTLSVVAVSDAVAGERAGSATRPGQVAVTCARIAAESVETSTAADAARGERGLDRPVQQRPAAHPGQVLAGNALAPGPYGDDDR